MEHGSVATKNKISYHKGRRSHHLFILLEGAEEGHINQISHEEPGDLKISGRLETTPHCAMLM
jgi:hypothetical protein